MPLLLGQLGKSDSSHDVDISTLVVFLLASLTLRTIEISLSLFRWIMIGVVVAPDVKLYRSPSIEIKLQAKLLLEHVAMS